MKKFLAILLVIAMLLPYGMTANAIASETEAIEVDPFYFVNASANVPEGLGYTYHMPMFWAANASTIYYDGHPAPAGSGYDSYDIEWIAKELKETFDNQPEGTRYVDFRLPRKAYTDTAESIVYLDNATILVREWVNAFLAEYSRIGGKLDGFLMDTEYENIESHMMWKRIYTGYYDHFDEDGNRISYQNTNIYKDIVNDPRYATEIRPLLEERGFKFWPNPTGDESEIWGINYEISENNPEYSKCDDIWDTVMQIRMVESLNEAVYEPMMKYYPDAIVSDYQVRQTKSWLNQISDYGNVIGFNAPMMGNATNFSSYNNRIKDSIFGTAANPNYPNIVGYNKAVFGSEPFTMTMWETNMFKLMYEAADTDNINAWITSYSGLAGTNATCNNSNTPYYTESLYHMGLLGMEPFIGYIVNDSMVIEQDADDTEEDIANKQMAAAQKALGVVSEIMAELTRVAGMSDREPILVPASWNGGYVLSGMYAGGRNIWRITPNTEIVSLENFKVAGQTAPTFSIDGQTITFPQGRIIADSTISEVGSCGYWVETPANVMPVITSVDNRYAEYPAYEENFEQYTAGTALSSATALPKAVWEISGSATVEADGNNKVLAISSNTNLTNVKLPQNITAGDSYAKQQGWEVTVTIPEGLSSEAELYLLSCAANDGFKVKDGQVYYARNGAYVELSGVSLSADTAYTFKREVDFRTAGAYKSSYSIYGSTGALIAEVKDVAMGNVTVPVTAIEISCKFANGNIQIDNYKLYPTGVTTDLSLYDARLGMKLTDLAQTRTEDTAYRVAWMNATNETKIAVVYNALNNKEIARVEMAPGQDGYATGVVEASADAPVKIAVRTEDGETATHPDYNDGDFTWPKWCGNTLSGTVTSNGSAEDVITLELVSGTSVVKTKLIPGNGGTYEFANLQVGEYTLRATKPNQCKACTTEYSITISANTAVQDVAIYSYDRVHTDPTCAANGSDVYTCPNCSNTYSEAIAALPHTEATRVENQDADTGSYDLVTYCTVCNTVLVCETVAGAMYGPARFFFTDVNKNEFEVTIEQGNNPKYLNTSNGALVEGGSAETGYHIKITYNEGENPKLYLNGAHLTAYGDGNGKPAITIGSETDDAYNKVSVDVIVENKTSWLYACKSSWGSPVIKGFIDGTLTLSCQNGGNLSMANGNGILYTGNTVPYGLVHAKNDLLLKNLKVTSAVKNIRSFFFASTSGNVIVDGGTLTLTKYDTPSNYSGGAIFQATAEGKKILIQNGANITITCKNSFNTTIFNGVTEIKDANVSASIETTATGKIFGSVPTLNYAENYKATVDGVDYDKTNFESVLLNGYNTIQNFTIIPVDLPKAQFAISTSIMANAVAESIVMTQGDKPIYLKTVEIETGRFTATTEGASKDDYNIMLTFNEGENPTLTLNGAKFIVANGNIPITIGSATTSAANDLAYDIVITDSVVMSHWTGWSHAFIASYTEGDLTIKGNGNALSLTHYIRRNSHSLIQAVGDVNLVDVNVTMGTKAEHQDTYANYITSTSGNINISGGSLTTTTERLAYIGVIPRTDIVMLNAPAGAVTITDGAEVKITVNSDAKGINALNGIAIKDSSVTITAPDGTLYSEEPTLEYTDPRYVLTKEEGSYAVAPHTPPYMQFTFASGFQKAELVKVITEGDAPIYLTGVDAKDDNKRPYTYLTDVGVTEENWTVMISFPKGGKATLTLRGTNLVNGHPGGDLVIIGYKGEHIMNNQDVVIDVIKDSTLYHTYGWSSPNIACYATGDLIINGKGGKLNVTNWSHATGANTLIPLSGIYAAGNVKLVDLDLNLSYMDGNANTSANMINCPNGDITVSGGKLTVTTGKFHTIARAALNAPAGAVTIENAVVNLTVQQGNTGIVAGNGTTIKDSSVTITAPEGTLYDTDPVVEFSGEYVLTNEGGVYSIKPLQSHIAHITFNHGSIAPLTAKVMQGGDNVYLKVVDGVVVLADGEADATITLTYPADGNLQIILNGAVIDMLYEHGAGIVIGDKDAESLYNNLNVDVVVKSNSIIKANCEYSNSAILSYISGTLTVISDGGLLEIDSRMALDGGAISAAGDVKLENAQIMMYSGWDEERGEYLRSENGNIVISGGMLQIMTNGRVTENVGYKLVNAVNGSITIENGANVVIFTDRSVTVFGAGEEGSISIADSTVQLATDNANATLFNKQPVLSTGAVASTEMTNVVLGDATEFGGNYISITKPGTAGAYNENAWNTYKYFSATAVSHIAGETVIESYVLPTYTEDGSYVEVVYCSVCGEEMSRNTVTIDVNTKKRPAMIIKKQNYQYCTNLAEALAAAEDGDTIYMLNNYVGAGLEINVDVTINMGSYYIYVSAPVDGTKAAVKIASTATLTLNGTNYLISSNKAAEKVLFDTLILNEGTLNVNGVTLRGNNLAAGEANARYTIRNTENAVANINSGETLKYPVNCVGTFTKGTDATVLIPDGYGWDAEGVLHLHNYNTVWVEATCAAKGGNVHTCERCGHSYITEEVVVPHTEGAVVKENVIKSTQNDTGSHDDVVYCSVCNAELSRTFVIDWVTGIKYAKINNDNTKLHDTLADAIMAAEDGDVVYLLRPYTGVGLDITKNITIVLNGFTYKINAPVEGTTAMVRIASGKNVILSGTGKIQGTTATMKLCDTIILNEGNLTVDGPTLYGYHAYMNGENGPNYTIKNTETGVTHIESGEITSRSLNELGTFTKGENASVYLPREGYWDKNDGGRLKFHDFSVVSIVGSTPTSRGYTKHACSHENCTAFYATNPFAFDCSYAIINGVVGYRKLADAFANAKDGDTIKIFRYFNGDALVVDKNLTIDLGSVGYVAVTPPENGPAAAVEILEGATLTLKGNGYLITAIKSKTLFDTLAYIHEGGKLVVEDNAWLRAQYLDKSDECYVVAGDGTVEFNSGKPIQKHKKIPTITNIPGVA